MKLRQITEAVIVAPSAFDRVMRGLWRQMTGEKGKIGLKVHEAKKKKEKSEVNYEDKSLSRHHKCSNCKHFKPKDRHNACSRVRGEIDPDGLCDLWEEILEHSGEFTHD